MTNTPGDCYKKSFINLNTSQKCVMVMRNAIPSYVRVFTKVQSIEKTIEFLGSGEKFCLGKDSINGKNEEE